MPRSRYQRIAPFAPVPVPLRRVGRAAEELDLHLLEFAAAEREVARVDLVAKRLADLADTERHAHARRVADVLEVDEDALRRLGPQIRDARVVLERTDVCLEHQVEGARSRQRARCRCVRREHLGAQCLVLQRARHRDGSRFLPAFALLQRSDSLAMRLEELGRIGLADLAGRCEQNVVVAFASAVGADELERKHGELIGAIARTRLAIVHHRIAEAADVTARFPDFRVHQQRAVETDHAERARRAGRLRRLVVMRDHVVPPRLLEVALELDTERAVIPGAVQAAVDFTRREDESPSLAERHYLFHRIHDRSERVRKTRRASIATRHRAVAHELELRAPAWRAWNAQCPRARHAHQKEVGLLGPAPYFGALATRLGCTDVDKTVS